VSARGEVLAFDAAKLLARTQVVNRFAINYKSYKKKRGANWRLSKFGSL